MNAPALRRYKPKKPTAKRADREGPEQAALMKEIQLRYPEAYELLYHVPNGGHRLKEVAAKLKAQGDGRSCACIAQPAGMYPPAERPRLPGRCLPGAFRRHGVPEGVPGPA